MFKSLTKLSLTAILLMSFVTSASAASSYGLYAMDGDEAGFYFNFEAYIGHEVEGTLAVRNYTDELIAVEINAVDASENYQSSFSLTPLQNEQYDIGLWITIEDPVITIEPGATELVDFTMLVPEGTAYGEYAGGVVVSERIETEALTGSGVQLVSQQALRVYTDVIEGEPEVSLGLSTDLSGQDHASDSVLSVNDGYMYILLIALAFNLILLMYFVYMQQKLNANLIEKLSQKKK
jgi:hypothetical protein